MGSYNILARKRLIIMLNALIVRINLHNSVGKEFTCNAQDLGWEDPLEKEMVTHSSIFAWRIPWTEEAGRPQSMGSQESDTT